MEKRGLLMVDEIQKLKAKLSKLEVKCANKSAENPKSAPKKPKPQTSLKSEFIYKFSKNTNFNPHSSITFYRPKTYK